MVALVANDTFWWLPVAIIAVRELGIQALPLLLGSRRASPCRPAALAKVKTVVQEVAVGLRACCPLTATDHRWVANTALWRRGRAHRRHRRAVRRRRQPRRHAPPAPLDSSRPCRCAVRSSPSGTELLLGQIVDTNSSWMGEQLAIIGIEHLRQTKVGDNLDRIVDALARGARARRRGDRVRRARAHPGRHHPRGHRRGDGRGARARRRRSPTCIRELFASRGRVMPDNNLRQADVPGGRHGHRAAHRHRARARSARWATRSSTRCPACPTR